MVLPTNDRAGDVIDLFKCRDLDKKYLGTRDAIMKSLTPRIIDPNRRMFVAGPMDFTGIGIKISRMVEPIMNGAFPGPENDRFPPPIRFSINSVSAFLMSRKTDVLLQILPILTSRVKKGGGIGFCVLNNESSDEKTISFCGQLTGGIVEGKTDGTTNSLRIRRLKGVAPDGFPLPVDWGRAVIAP